MPANSTPCFFRYGPFWTCTTLIFVAASIATFVTYLSHKWHKKEWTYDINLVTWSAGLFYGYVTFVPLGLYVILKYFSAPAGLVQLWCLYGYSLFIFIPASVCNILKMRIDFEFFRMLVAALLWFIVSSLGFSFTLLISFSLQYISCLSVFTDPIWFCRGRSLLFSVVGVMSSLACKPTIRVNDLGLLLPTLMHHKLSKMGDFNSTQD